MRHLFKTAGTAVLILVFGTGLLLVTTGRLRVEWGPRPVKPDEHADHDATSHPAEGRIVLDAEAIGAAGIRTQPAAVGSIARTLAVTGEVQLATDRVAHVTPRIPGTLRGADRTIGDAVSKDQPLCSVESVELGEARAAHVSADSELTLTERNWKRWQELYEKGLRTQNELWAAENEFTRARIHHEAATNKLKALGIEDAEIAALDSRTLSNRYMVTSPITGVVLERHATLGENVDGKDVLFLIADLSEVWVQAAVYEKDLRLVRNGMPATVRTQAYPDVPFAGTLAYVGEMVVEKTRTVPIRITVKNGPAPSCAGRFALRPGMFVTVDLELSRRENVVVVPRAAIQTSNEQSLVFVKGPAPAGGNGATFERRVVTLGERDDDSVEIVKGLKAGEEVVVDNAYLLKSELEKSRIADSD